MGGHLATINSEEENEFLYSLVDNPDFWLLSSGRYQLGPWLGGLQNRLNDSFSEPDGGWEWITGEPFDFQAWAPGQPDESSNRGQDVLRFFGDRVRAATWDDGTLSTGSGNSYIVEFETPITRQPASVVANVGATVSFDVGVTGDNVSFQWKFNGAPIAAETGSQITISDIRNRDGGAYSVSVTTEDGVTFESDIANLTVSDVRLEIYSAVELVFSSSLGKRYQVQESIDGSTWGDVGALVDGTGNEQSVCVSTRNAKMKIFRILEQD